MFVLAVLGNISCVYEVSFHVKSMIVFLQNYSGLIGDAALSKEDMFICEEFLQVISVQTYIRLIFSFFINVYLASTLICVEKWLEHLLLFV